VRRPTGHAGDGEHRREQIDRNSEIVVQGSTVKIDIYGDVRVFARAEDLLGGLLDQGRHLVPPRVADTFPQRLGHRRYDVRPGVVHIVDRMPEPEDLAARVELGVDEIRHFVGTAELEQHLHHLGVRPAVERSGQRAHTGGDRRVHVRLGGRHLAGGKRGGVERVLGVQDECRVDGPGRGFVRSPPIQHVEEIGGVTELRRRRDRVLAAADAVPGGDNGRELGDQPMGHSQGGLPGVFRDVGVVVGEHGHRCLKDVHRQRLGRPRFKCGDELRGDSPFGGQLGAEAL